MTRLLSSELLKLRTTRTFLTLMGGALALIVAISVPAAAAGNFETTATPDGRCSAWPDWRNCSRS